MDKRVYNKTIQYNFNKIKSIFSVSIKNEKVRFSRQ